MGLTDVSVDIQSNWVTATPPADHAIPLHRIEWAISRAGYVPDELSIRARGTFEREDDAVVFRIVSWPRSFRVTNATDVPAGVQTIAARVTTADESVSLELMDRG